MKIEIPEKYANAAVGFHCRRCKDSNVFTIADLAEVIERRLAELTRADAVEAQLAAHDAKAEQE